MSTLGQLQIAALTNIPHPPQLSIDVRKDYDSLMNDVGRRSVGFDGVTLFGCAFVQGGRLQFTTAISIQKMLDISEHHRANKGDSIDEVLIKSNRPREPAHEKKIADYLLDTACVGDKFILPSFTFNFGTRNEEDTLDVQLILLDPGHDGSTTWPAVLLLPRRAKLETTDGAHRRNTLYTMLADKKLAQDKKDFLLDNAVDVKLVFESSMRGMHQDFADCGQTKPISKSQLTAYDGRNSRNRLATTFAKQHPFMKEFVDASANNVNLSAKSHRVWSLAAMRTMIEHILKEHPLSKNRDQSDSVDELTVQNLGPFIDELVKHMPQLKMLEVNRQAKLRDIAASIEPNSKNKSITESITGTLREQNGGDVALRGVGLFMFARAYVHCVTYDMPFADMAKILAGLDWHVLTCNREDVPLSDDPDEYAKSVFKHANPLWRALIVVKSRRYKITASTNEANRCWDLITTQFMPQQQAAE